MVFPKTFRRNQISTQDLEYGIIWIHNIKSIGQGYALGPCLYLLYFNDLFNFVPMVKVIILADNTVFLLPH